jgi:[ribosomal protein S5]-alanine N-acetyltransferase
MRRVAYGHAVRRPQCMSNGAVAEYRWEVRVGDAAVVPAELTTPRLRLPLLDAENVAALVAGRRLPGWADDFPAEGDVEIARALARDGVPAGPDAVFGPRLVVEAATAEAVGTAGFLGPPRDGVVEIGYGIVPSRRRRGYAGEAVRALLDLVAAQPGVTEVVAHAEAGNIASIRVLQRNGLTYQGREGSLVRYAVPLT